MPALSSKDNSTKPTTFTATVTVHSWLVRITHWINVLAILVMVLSGWLIYNASPLFDFRFPKQLTMGGWLAGALQWHFAMMWLLVANNLLYVISAIVSGHFRKRLLPVTKAQLRNDFISAITFKLEHKPGVYNAIQRATYVGVIFMIILLIASGLAIWKPVQLQELTWLMGDYEGARRVHFFAMALLIAFLIIHVAMALLTPKTLISMITGKATIAHGTAKAPKHADIPSTESGDAL
ncbi:MAG TPA: cytochrome b/b6 domain-containing protein [Burkholderiales bacterium]|nr:cytochrome b/b6 domain-containing protein [Burkholderiales bacterium]